MIQNTREKPEGILKSVRCEIRFNSESETVSKTLHVQISYQDSTWYILKLFEHR